MRENLGVQASQRIGIDTLQNLTKAPSYRLVNVRIGNEKGFIDRGQGLVLVPVQAVCQWRAVVTGRDALKAGNARQILKDTAIYFP
jgi:hypothetical protein